MNITVGIPVTRTKYLLQALQSVAAQSIHVHEVIVVDNGADNDVSALISQIPLPIRLIKREHRLPPVENWNLLLAEVSSKWFILLSDDDYFAPDHFAQLKQITDLRPDAMVLHTRVRLVNSDGIATALTPHAPAWESAWDFLWHRSMGFRIQFLSDFAWNTAALRAVGGFADLPSAWGTDDLTVFRVAQFGGIAFGARPTFNYRLHANSISASYSAEDKLVAIEMLMTEYKREVRQALAKFNDPGDVLVLNSTLRTLPAFRYKLQKYVLSNVRLAGFLTLCFKGVFGVSPYKISTWSVVKVCIFNMVAFAKPRK